MNIVISAHFDIARPIMSMKLDENGLNGLVDNFAGVFVSYEVFRKIGIPVYLTNYEELDFDGAISVAKNIDKETIVIVVDTILESDTDGKHALISNAYRIDTEPLKQILSGDIHFIDGYFEETEDESYIYGHEFGLKTFYFGIPIPKGYHDTQNLVSLQTIDKSTEVLMKVIEALRKM